MELFNAWYTRTPSHWSDFRAFYAAGYLLRTQPSHLYDLAWQQKVQANLISDNGIFIPFYHPSYEALIFAPLSLLSYAKACGIFMGFSVLCLVGAFYAARPLFTGPLPYLQTRPGLVLIFFLPLLGAIFWGQDSLLFLVLFCVMWRQLSRGEDFTAGIALGLALFRFQLAIPLAVLIAVRRGRRFTAGFLTAAVVVLLLCLALIGKDGIASLFHLLTRASLAGDQGAHAQQLMKVHPTQMPNLNGLLYVAVTRHLHPGVAFCVIALASLSLFSWTALQVHRTHSESKALVMATLCSVLLSYHLFPYDLTLLLPAFVLMVRDGYQKSVLLLYWLPLVLYLSLGGHSLFLYAISLLCVLFHVSSSPKDLRECRGQSHPSLART